MVRNRHESIARFNITEDSTLLATAMTLLRDHKTNKVKSMLRHNQLAVNGEPSSQFDRPVRAGDVLEVNFTRSFDVFSHPSVRLLYSDDDIMVVEKPAGMLATGDGRANVKETVFHIMREFVKRRNDRAHVYVVHRLEREASGVMLLARTKKVREQLVTSWGTLVGERTYAAVVEGLVDEDSGQVKGYLAEDEETHLIYATDDKTVGKPATTPWKVVERGRRNTLLEISLKNASKHQIRVQMSHMGHPISGDRSYGGHASPLCRLALHCLRLTLNHPTTGKPLTVTSPLPEGFERLLK